MSGLFGGGSDASAYSGGQTDTAATQDYNPSAPASSGSGGWPTWANANNASDALKIVAQLQQMDGQKRQGLPPAASGPQLLRGSPAAPMQPVTAQPVTRESKSTTPTGGGGNLLALLQMLMKARQ